MNAAEVLVIRKRDEVGLLPPEGISLRADQLLDELLVGPIDDIDSASAHLVDADFKLIGAHLDDHPLNEHTVTLLSSIFSKILRKVPLLLPQSLMKYCSLW